VAKLGAKFATLFQLLDERLDFGPVGLRMRMSALSMPTVCSTISLSMIAYID